MSEITCDNCGRVSEISLTHRQSCWACGKEFKVVDIVHAIAREGLAEAARIVAEGPKKPEA